MKIFLTLLKMNLNLNFGISALKYKFTKEKKKRWEPILILLGLVVGFGPLLGIYTVLMRGIFSVGLSLNQPGLVIAMAFVAGQFMVFIFGIFYIMGTFYFSKDINILIPLPIKPYQVLGSKMLMVMINEYLTLMPILLPPLIIYGIGTNQGFFYWIKAIILILTSPALPLVLDAFFILILMRFVNVKKSKDLFAIIGGFVGIFIGIGLNMLLQNVPKGNEQEFLKNILTSNTGLISIISEKFPPSLWATLGLTNAGIKGLAYITLFIIVSILLFALLMILGNIVFYKGVISGQEVSRKKKRLSSIEASEKYGKVSSPVLAIFIREWRLLLRTPVYFLNGLTGIIMGPLLIAIMFFSGGQSTQTQQLLSILNNPEMSIYITLGGLAFALFTAGMNIAASTAVSREGSTFWISKVIPVPPRQQVMGKYLNNITISILAILTTDIILSVFFKFSIKSAIIILILGTIGSIIMVALNLMIDVYHPKLVWNNPQEAMKQNMNGLLGMITSLITIAVFALIVVLLFKAGVSEIAIYISLAIIMSVLSVLSIIVLFYIADKQYKKLEI